MSDRKEFIWPWQKNWPKPPADAKLVSHMDQNFNHLLLAWSSVAILLSASHVAYGPPSEIPSYIEGPLSLTLLAVIIYGISSDLFRPRFWKLYLWKDGGIFQTLFTHLELTASDLKRLEESSRFGLSLKVASNGKIRYASFMGIGRLDILREALDKYSNLQNQLNDKIFCSPFNFAKLRNMLLFSNGYGLFYSAITIEPESKLFDIRWMPLFFASCLIAGHLVSLVQSFRIRVATTREKLTMTHFREQSICWEDVVKVTIVNGEKFGTGSLYVETPDKTITIPETVINYWQLVKQVKARIPATDQVVEN